MSSFEQSLGAEGGLVVSTGGYSGGMDYTQTPVVSQVHGLGVWTLGLVGRTAGPDSVLAMAVGILLVALVIYVLVFFVWGHVAAMSEGYKVSGTGSNNLGFYGSPSDNLKVSGFQDAGRIAQQRWEMRDTFQNSRDTPYFAESSNETLRREDRETEAMRALAKINQERQRRSTDGDVDPLPFGPFYKEWIKAHPLSTDKLESYTDFNPDELVAY